jgi:hypothetical protein
MGSNCLVFSNRPQPNSARAAERLQTRSQGKFHGTRFFARRAKEWVTFARFPYSSVVPRHLGQPWQSLLPRSTPQLRPSARENQDHIAVLPTGPSRDAGLVRSQPHSPGMCFCGEIVLPTNNVFVCDRTSCDLSQLRELLGEAAGISPSVFALIP